MAENHNTPRLGVGAAIRPLSTRETFVTSLCGVPCAHGGCQRYREAGSYTDAVGKSLRATAIPDWSGDGTAKHDLAATRSWLLVTSGTDRVELDAKYIDSTSLPVDADSRTLSHLEDEFKKYLKSNEYGVALFGLSCPIPLRGSSRSALVLFCGFWINDANGWFPLDRWEPTHDDDRHNLSEVFGSAIFEPLRLAATSGAEAVTLNVSIADLINRYADRRCKHYRRDEGHRFRGIAQCMTERALDLHMSPAWRHFPPVISVVDPSTREAKHMVEESSLVREHGLAFARLGVDESGMHPAVSTLGEFTRPDGAADKDVFSYVDLFSSFGRRHLLPSESSRSYVSIPRGEVVCVLLSWIMLRILVHDAVDGDGQFKRRLDDWRAAMRDAFEDAPDFLRSPSNDKVIRAVAAFELLLNERVVLPRVARLADGQVLALGYSDRSTGEDSPAAALIREAPIRFGTVLEQAALGVDHFSATQSVDTPNVAEEDVRSVSIQAAAVFLRAFFSDDARDASFRRASDFRQVPMYRRVRWKAHPALNQAIGVFGGLVYAASREHRANEVGESAMQRMRLRTFMLVLHSITHQVACGSKDSWVHDASADLEYCTRNAVFPFSVAISSLHVPFAVYLIIPLHEERIGSMLRPVVFAHVLSGGPSWEAAARAAWSTSEEIDESADLWTTILTPLGNEIGHALFDRLLASHAEEEYHLRSGYVIAHELNTMVNKHGLPIVRSILADGDPQFVPLRDLYARLSTFAELAIILSDVSVGADDAGDDRRSRKTQRQVQRLFRPLAAVVEADPSGASLLKLVSAVASQLYVEACAGRDSTVSLEIDPLPESSSEEAGSQPWETLALLLGELIRNFVAYAAETGNGTGILTSRFHDEKLECRLTQHVFENTRQPRTRSLTFDYLATILGVTECGKATRCIENGDLVLVLSIDLSAFGKETPK